MAVHQRSPSNLKELERIHKEEWQRIPKSRASPLEKGESPAELLMNQKLRTRLLSAEHQVNTSPELNDHSQIKHYHQTAKPRKPTATDDMLRVRCGGTVVHLQR
ncbi:hypothetical protein NFI96_030182 [Prochilodus magdalenae]|nr:hypothetical protein NFI96_030182 [Prochilodus magdalenae]